MNPLSIFSKTSLMALAGMTLLNCTGSPEKDENIHFYVGSSNACLSRSIFLCELDPVQETIVALDSFAGARAASYLAFSPGENYLFAINQEPWKETELATVTSFATDPGNRALRPINSQCSEGADICHISSGENGDYIFAANYGSGHATVLPVDENGTIEPASSVVTGAGSGPVTDRQQGPHAHQAMPDPGQNFLLVPDLGTDRVWIYAFDHENGKLTPNPAQASFSLAPGAGPRHLAFHPDGSSLYIVNELNSTITACSYDREHGAIRELNTLSTVDESHRGMKYPAAVRVHPNGKYVYASTRGENSCISTFGIHTDGSLERIQVMEHVPNWPRDFNLDPSGRIMLVAGERSDEIRLYTIDPENGMISETAGILQLPAPASVLFVK